MMEEVQLTPSFKKFDKMRCLVSEWEAMWGRIKEAIIFAKQSLQKCKTKVKRI